ncbi:MAG TPA: tetratricopeptide repeat protein [Bacteroidia bacterium]|nr:tetratricopeptide repeat protein [Bacteroidia bacterium]
MEKREIAYSFKNIGSIYNGDNSIKQSLDYYNRSLKMYEEIKDMEGIANVLFVIGKIYNIQQDRKRALSYKEKSTKLQEQVEKEIGNANRLNKLAYEYNKQGKINEALESYYKSLRIYFEINDKPGIINSLNNMGTIYLNKGDKKQGLAYYDLSLKIKKDSKQRKAEMATEINNQDRVAYSLANIASIYLKQKKYALAGPYSDTALLIAKEYGYTKSICKSESLLAKIDSAAALLVLNSEAKTTALLIRAQAHYKQYLVFRDSVGKQKTQSAAGKKHPSNMMPGEKAEQPAGNMNKTGLFIIISCGVLFFAAYVCFRIFKNKKNS